MFSEDLYNLIVEKLNANTQSVIFKGGYLIGIYETIPYVVNQSDTTSKFNYFKEKVIPVSEEVSQETPSVNLADRSDYIFQYQVMFQSSRKDKVLTALNEFRDYFFTNKQHVIDGYKVGFKTSRGNKVGTQPHGGDYWTFYKISVYLTAIKNGYIKKDTDKWEIRLTGVGDYETLKIDTDTTGTTGVSTFSNATGKGLGHISNTTLASKLRFFYNSGEMEKKVYLAIMNKLDKDTVFDIKHTFDGTTHTYQAYISGGVRTLADNGTVILDFNWIEADV